MPNEEKKYAEREFIEAPFYRQTDEQTESRSSNPSLVKLEPFFCGNTDIKLLK